MISELLAQPTFPLARRAPRAAVAWLQAAALAFGLGGLVHSPVVQAQTQAQAQAQAARPAIESFFQEPLLSGALLSPDGRTLAMRVATRGARSRLVALDLQSLKPTVVASFSDADIGQFQWVNERRLVFDLRTRLTGPGRVDIGQGLFAVNADGEEFRQLVETRLSFVKSHGGGTEQLPWNTHLYQTLSRQDSDDVFVTRPEEVSKDKVDYFKLLRLNTLTGRAREIDAPLHSQGWLLDAKGELRMATTYQGDQMTVQVRQADGRWKALVERERYSANAWAPRYIGPDGQIYAEAQPTDKTGVYTLDAATGVLGRAAAAASKDFDLHPSFIANANKLLGLRYTIDAEITQWLDADMKALQMHIDTLLPATANRLGVPARGDSQWVLVEAFADVQPTLTYLYHRGTRKLSSVGAARPDIQAAQMGQTDFMRITARDGLPLPAYLTLPATGPKKGLPMVVLAHGGPWVRGASWRWDAEVQFLASRGYAVLQPEFRGSTGFGWKHFRAGWKQWGLAMQDDLADAARWAIVQGIADPQRICIAGASYGGYATLMGLAKEPELYRCGINWVGVSDIDLMYSVGWSDIHNEFKTLGMPRLIGDPVKDAERLKTASPLANAAKIKQPLLMAYGAWDVRVPLVHGEKLRDALKPHNPQVQWVVYEDEGHGWQKAETRIDFWGRVERFLNQHIGKP